MASLSIKIDLRETMKVAELLQSGIDDGLISDAEASALLIEALDNTVRMQVEDE